MRQIMILAALAILVILCAVKILGRGEVVTITTVSTTGGKHDTPLWIVEIDGKLYLRAGSPKARWLARLENESQIGLKRDRVTRTLHARALRDDRASRTAVNRAMAEKYGLADRVVGFLVDHEQSVPIVLRAPGR